MSEVEEIFKYYTEVHFIFRLGILIFDVDVDDSCFTLEDNGKSYRGEEEFDNVALSWK